eukprot:2745662-Rhodomonas_salina.4
MVRVQSEATQRLVGEVPHRKRQDFCMKLTRLLRTVDILRRKWTRLAQKVARLLHTADADFAHKTAKHLRKKLAHTSLHHVAKAQTSAPSRETRAHTARRAGTDLGSARPRGLRCARRPPLLRASRWTLGTRTCLCGCTA